MTAFIYYIISEVKLGYNANNWNFVFIKSWCYFGSIGQFLNI